MSEIKFPHLFESVYNKQVVKFYSEHEGEVIIIGLAPFSWDVGTGCSDLYSCYNTSHWKPYAKDHTISFPCLMESIDKGYVVCFTSDRVGTVVLSDHPHWPIGMHSCCWSSFTPKRGESNWKPYKQPENKPMNVSISTIEALARLEAIEAEQKELRKLLESSEKKEDVGSLIYSSTESCSGNNSFFRQSLDEKFQTPELADKYAEAFETFIKLRQQPGSVINIEGTKQYTIGLGVNYDIYVDHFYGSSNKSNQLSPCFSTQEYVESAIKNVGEEAILQMMKTFSHYEGE